MTTKQHERESSATMPTRTARSLSRTTLAGAFALALSGAFAAAHADTGISERKIRFGYTLSVNSAQGQGARYFAEQVEKKSGGKIKVDTFPNAQLGNDVQQQAALQGGVQEIAVPAPSTLVGTVKEFGIFDFPFLFSRTDEAYAFLDGPVGRELLDKLNEKNLVGLVFLENGWRHFTSSRRPLTKVEDFAGQKIRTMQSPVWVDLIKSLKATPVALPFGELFLALESRAVDAQENPISTIYNAKFYEVQKYLSLSYHSYHPLILLVGKPFWDKLSPQEKQIFEAAAAETRAFQRQVSQTDEKAALEALKTSGFVINEIAPEERARLKEAARAVTDKYSAAIGQATIDKVNAELARLRNP